MSSWGLSQHIETISCGPLGLILYKTFLKNKKRSGTSLPVSFSKWILKKNVSLVMLYYLTKFHCLVAFTSLDFGHNVYCNCLLTMLWRHKFWNWPYLSNKAIFSTWQKVKYLANEKSFLRWNKKHFSSLLKGFHWSK